MKTLILLLAIVLAELYIFWPGEWITEEQARVAVEWIRGNY